MEKLHVTKVYRSNQLIKKGTPEEKEIPKLSIKTAEYGDNWLSTFKTRPYEKLEEGQTIVATVEKSGTFMNFREPTVAELAVVVLEMVDKGASKPSAAAAGPESEDLDVPPEF